ncbi:hypothetical protein GP486_000567 [Trichoglossum hirsutum]|uniref:Uncharacterized protein n=1 Tax=Trichoglossum hirsutum TaxID=265104 RepID=A0A9P8LIC6_9PEZI|nr:hypothetical protein GP486_000567 [Trichoglossum hirsutum]
MVAGTVWCSTDGEIAHVNNVHTFGKITALACMGEGIDTTTSGRFGNEIQAGGVGDRAVGLTAAEFVPGFRARVISVGADGRCALVDFEVEGKKTGVVLSTWHVRAPATSLSILQVDDSLFGVRKSGSSAAQRNEKSVGVGRRGGKGLGPYLVAVGRVDGKVVVINSVGELLGEMTVDPDGGQVVSVEWAIEPEENHNKDKGAVVSANHRSKKQPPSIPARHPESRVPLGRRKRKSMSSILAAGRDVEEEVLLGHDDTREPENVRSPCNTAEVAAKVEDELISERGPLGQPVWQDVVEPLAPDYMNLFSPVRQKARQSPRATTLPLTKERKSETPREGGLLASGEGDAKSTISAPLVVAGEVSLKKPGYSSVSQGITPRRTRRASTRKAVPCTSQQSSRSTTRVIEDRRLLAEMKSVRGNVTGVKGSGFALFAPYMQKGLVRGPTDSSTLQPSEGAPILEVSTDAVGDIWLTDASGNEKRGSRKRRKASQKSSESASCTNNRNHKAVSFGPPLGTECDEQASPSKRSPRHRFLVHGDIPEPVKRQPGPNPLPSELQGGTPLTEINHNVCSPSKRNRSYSPKPCSPRATTPVGFLESNSQPHCCSSYSQLHEEVAKLHEEMRVFQAKMIREFQGQKRWFEEIVAGERKASEAVREENERLRRELFEGIRAEVGLRDRRER